MKKEPQKFFSRPRDESLQAYKDWISGMFTAITGRSTEEDDGLTEEVWIERWREFWKKARELKSNDLKGE